MKYIFLILLPLLFISCGKANTDEEESINQPFPIKKQLNNESIRNFGIAKFGEARFQ